VVVMAHMQVITKPALAQSAFDADSSRIPHEHGFLNFCIMLFSLVRNASWNKRRMHVI